MARKYQHTQELLEVIKHLQAEGQSQKEIEDYLGLKWSRPASVIKPAAQHAEMRPIAAGPRRF